MEKTDILAINPGSTSTKIGVFRDEEKLFEKTIAHDPDKLLSYGTIPGQLPYRMEILQTVLTEMRYPLADLAAVVGRGGILVGLKGGGYYADAALCKAMKRPDIPQHASNLGAMMAWELAAPLHIPSYIYDSTVGCELTELAKISGLAEIERYGCFHVLNARAQAMHYADAIGADYRKLQLIVCHMGGGITVSALKDGKIIDGSSYDDGPMSPERTGGIPLILWTDLCYSGKYTREEMQKKICGKGGLYSYLGTTSVQEVEHRIAQGDRQAETVLEAMAYQTAKAIAAAAVTFAGKVDAVILTGGAAHSRYLTEKVKAYAGWVGEFVIMPGEDELGALARGAQRILRGTENARRYTEETQMSDGQPNEKKG